MNQIKIPIPDEEISLTLKKSEIDDIIGELRHGVGRCEEYKMPDHTKAWRLALIEKLERSKAE